MSGGCFIKLCKEMSLSIPRLGRYSEIEKSPEERKRRLSCIFYC